MLAYVRRPGKLHSVLGKLGIVPDLPCHCDGCGHQFSVHVIAPSQWIVWWVGHPSTMPSLQVHSMRKLLSILSPLHSYDSFGSCSFCSLLPLPTPSDDCGDLIVYGLCWSSASYWLYFGCPYPNMDAISTNPRILWRCWPPSMRKTEEEINC